MQPAASPANRKSNLTPDVVPAPSAGVRDRALFANFFRRELRTRYLGSVTGLAWAFIHPLVLLVVYHFVFTTVFRTERFGNESFLAFVAVALWPWLAAQEGIQRGATSLMSYAGLIRKVAFPHELVVYASVCGTLVLQLAGYVAVLVALVVYGEPLHLSGLLLALPLWIVLAIGVIGIALFFAALQVFVRDVEHVLMPVLMILMYLTPILYPLKLVPASMRPWVEVNPFTWLVRRLRDALIDGRLALEWGDLFAVVVALALLLGGRWVFRRLSPHFEDFV
ncbi:MAG: ABC transporter permease [Burkholderiales bacterium]|nr:ABC transporter permease [Burkholderiales bacterium]